MANARRAASSATAIRTADLRVGCAQDTSSFSKSEGIGDLGVQVIAVQAGDQRHAYILWDGNNAVPQVTGKIGQALRGLVDGYAVMTTDNHSVNAIAGAYGPVGYLADPDRIAEATRAMVERALSNLEPVEAGFARVTVENFRVFGHQKTVQLSASINVMTSILGELVGALVVTQALGVALLFYLLGVL
jgi:putative membrane protein